MTANAAPPLAYRLLASGLMPLFAAHSAYVGLREQEPGYAAARLGLRRTVTTHGAIWVHAASVGEVATVWPLIEAVRERHPVLVTTNTVTGARVVRARAGLGVSHDYLPWDSASAVRAFLEHHRPQLGLIIETELWPRLYTACGNMGVPLVLVNARVTPRTLHAPAFLLDAYSSALTHVRAVLTRSESDREGYLKLGADADRITICGNLKWSGALPDAVPPNLIGRPYWLAASTHEDEELRLTRLWLAQPRRNRLLVVAPRHPARSKTILRELRRLPCRVAVRSHGDAIASDTDVYLADSIGELQALIAHADWVFIGGSLVPRGGHNVLEPARHGRATLIGPHVDNFAQEVETLRSADALLQVSDEAELTPIFSRLAAEPGLRAALGTRALNCVRGHHAVLDVYLAALRPFLEGLRHG